jgi:hypothetical protein
VYGTSTTVNAQIDNTVLISAEARIQPLRTALEWGIAAAFRWSNAG